MNRCCLNCGAPVEAGTCRCTACGQGDSKDQVAAKRRRASPFEAVVAWYRRNLPGWQDSTRGEPRPLGRRANELTPQNITVRLEAAAADGQVIRISLFKPPPGSKSHQRVAIVQQGDKPVAALLPLRRTPEAPRGS